MDPLRIHIDADMKPPACHIKFSIHRQRKVEKDIQREEALRILDKVHYNVLVT